MQTSRVTWTAQNLSINMVREEANYLFDRYGTPFHKSVSDYSATFEITGKIDWVGRGWSQEKVDGLLPFLNEKLKEYEDGFLHRGHSDGPDATQRVPVPGVYEGRG